VNSTDFLNEVVKVTIDRPLGSKHPPYGFIYPLNYGYISGVIAPDGENLDVYVLGDFEAVSQFEGKCIAIVQRIEDRDDKLIVVAGHRSYRDEQIQA
jgi:inorganic pyrophosphatase